MFHIGYPELIVLLFVAVMLFGRRLPEAARSVGKAFVELKKGIMGVEDEVGTPAPSVTPAPRLTDKVGVAAPKFEEPSAVSP